MFRRSKFQRHLVTPLLLTCLLSGCYKWSVQPTPATLAEPPERARITLDDGRVVELRSLEIRGDSVVGFAKTDRYNWGDTIQTYPLADVHQLDYRIFDGLGTGILIGSIVIVAGGLIAGAAALSEWECCL
jgi:hypothetical protein